MKHGSTLARASLRGAVFGVLALGCVATASGGIGEEKAIARHLHDGEEFRIGVPALVKHGKDLFAANWTIQEGGGRPQTKGVGAPLSDPSDPLTFPRNFNRLSAPDSNSCAGCHNVPRIGGGGDIVANVFVLGHRFDFATFDGTDSIPTKGAVDENGNPVTLQTVANSRNTLGMFGSGYIEMLARQITGDLQSIRDRLRAGQSASLASKGIRFGTLARNVDGSWDTSGVTGLPAPSLATSGPNAPPNLILRPFHQAGAVISLRQFTNNAMNHHHGIQSTERFGVGTDPDGDGFTDEMTRADMTAVTLYQAQLAVPGRVIPRDDEIEQAVRRGERVFLDIGCADCHIPSLPLDNRGWMYSEPNPYNPAGNLRPADGVRSLTVDLTDERLQQPRLSVEDGVVHVSAFTDFKLHDITSGPDDPNREPLDMQHPAGSAAFFAGNSKFLTRKLWGTANEPPFFHHGLYTTLRQAIEAHHGEAESSTEAWHALSDHDRNTVIEFLKTLQVLPEGTRALVVDERGLPRRWRAAWEPEASGHDGDDRDDRHDHDDRGHGDGDDHDDHGRRDAPPGVNPGLRSGRR